MAQAHVPKVSNWDQDDNAPTQFFDHARKGRNTDKLVNPNDPRSNPEVFSRVVPPVHAPPFRTSSDGEAPKPKDERRTGRDNSAMMQKPSSDSPHHRNGDRVNASDHQKKGSRLNANSDRSFEQSPIHPDSHVKYANKGGSASPYGERRGSSGGHSHVQNTPGRSKPRPGGRGSETQPDNGSAVPVFGEWDNDPSAGEGYTDIFNKVSQEKKIGPAKVPMISKDDSYMEARKQDRTSDCADCPCFGWCRK